MRTVRTDEPGGAGSERGAQDLLEQEALGDVRLLRNKPFRRLVLAHATSNLALWAFYGALITSATFEQGATTRQLALLGVSLSLPFVLGTVLQGMVVDRWSPKWVYVAGILTLGGAAALGWYAPSLTWMYGSSFLVGLGWASLEPSRSSLTALLIPQRDLIRANGVLALAFQITILSGSLLGGVLIDHFDHGVVYGSAIAITLLAAAIATSMPDIRQQGERPEIALSGFSQGLRTSWNHPELRLLLFVTAVGWMVFNAFFVLEPLYVRHVLHRGDAAVLYLWAAHGAGAILGSYSVSRIKRGAGKELALVGGGVAASGIGLLIYSGFGIYQVAFPGAALIGAGLAFFYPPALALVQRVVGEDEQGRVSGVLLSLQELMALLGSTLIVIVGLPDDLVQAVLIGIASAMVLVGLLGLRAVSRLRRRTDV